MEVWLGPAHGRVLSVQKSGQVGRFYACSYLASSETLGCLLYMDLNAFRGLWCLFFDQPVWLAIIVHVFEPRVSKLHAGTVVETEPDACSCWLRSEAMMMLDPTLSRNADLSPLSASWMSDVATISSMGTLHVRTLPVCIESYPSQCPQLRLGRLWSVL